MRPSRLVPLLAFALFALDASAPPSQALAAPSTLSRSDVTIFGAAWCPACRSLEKTLADRNVPFEVIDVDKSPQAFERARSSAGASNAIPLTGVARGSDTVWIVGADADGVERAYRGN